MIEEYIGEIVVGSSGLIISLVIGGIKAIYSRIGKIEDRLADMDKRIDINTALDKAREGK